MCILCFLLVATLFRDGLLSYDHTTVGLCSGYRYTISPAYRSRKHEVYWNNRGVNLTYDNQTIAKYRKFRLFSSICSKLIRIATLEPGAIFVSRELIMTNVGVGATGYALSSNQSEQPRKSNHYNTNYSLYGEKRSTEKTYTSGGTVRMEQSHWSAYHETCTPKTGGTQTIGSGPSKHSRSDIPANDEVTRDKIWRQSVEHEVRGLKSWKENWGFLAEFDEKGRPKSAVKLPEKVTVFSSTFPNTTGATYGDRLDTEPGLAMQKLEFQFYSDRRRRKMGNEMVCY